MSVFAWKPTDMPSVPRNLIEHSLNVDDKAKLIKQKLRRFARDKKEAIRVEVTRLLAAGFIKEVYHPEWLANPVLVRKKNKEWRMCIDYTDLNKHCPKDPFGLPHIDEVIVQLPIASWFPFSIANLVITRSLSKRMTRSRHPSSCPSAPTATRPCRSGSRTLGLPTNAPYRPASKTR